MEDTYYDPSAPASFGGVDKFAKHSGRSLKEIKDWLSGEDSYTLHKQPPGSRFKRRKTIASGINHIWQIDLVDLQSLAAYNDGYRYLLTCIDVFSRVARVVAIKNKTASTVVEAIKKMLDNAVQPCLKIQSDKGTEFKNTAVLSLLTDYNIEHYNSENDDINCSLVERFNRTLRSKMFRYFTQKNTNRYIDVLDDLIKSYNVTFHSAIKTSPAQVNAHNEREIYARLYGDSISKQRQSLALSKFKLNVGDSVRILESKRVFRRGYLTRWSEEIYFIKYRHATDPHTFTIRDFNGETILGKFYASELQKIKTKPESQAYKIERVIKTRKTKRKGRGAAKVQYYVKWLGYPDSHNSWVDDINSSTDG